MGNSKYIIFKGSGKMNNMEIERKYLVDPNKFSTSNLEKIEITQGYISDDINGVVRIRTADDTAYLTIKSKTQGISRAEYEYEIPLQDAVQLMLLFCEKVISKTRYIHNYMGCKWEIDCFNDDNNGLFLAEIELSSENEIFQKPEYVLDEVSYDYRYFNNNLLTNPYTKWDKESK